MTSNKTPEQAAKKRYVLGFVFRDNHTSVVLIRKSKPKWQAGLLNGPGGKIEDGEDPLTAMTREFKEETGVEVSSWRRFGEMRGEDWIVYLFSCADSDAWEKATTMEGEEIVKVHPDELGDYDCVSNLHWLVELGIDENYGKDFYALINYCQPFTFEQAITQSTAAQSLETQSKIDAALQAQASAWQEERTELCAKLLVALSAITTTPEETYGCNLEWAVSDTCRAIQKLANQALEIERLRGQVRELEEVLAELRDAVKLEPAMNNMKYDALGARVNKALSTRQQMRGREGDCFDGGAQKPFELSQAEEAHLKSLVAWEKQSSNSPTISGEQKGPQ